MDSVISVEAPAYALAAIRFAAEGAFTEHLRRLQLSVGPQFARLAAQDEWLARRAQWLREIVDLTGEHAT